MTLAEHVAAGAARLGVSGLPAPEVGADAAVLARHVLGWDREAYLCRLREPAPAAFADRYAGRAEPSGAARAGRHDRRTTRVPGTGVEGEPGRAHAASGNRAARRRDVAPRGRLERQRAPHRRRAGTGSGCLAIALATELPAARIVATDISAAALVIARRNAVRHRVRDRITWVRTSWLDGVAGCAGRHRRQPPVRARWRPRRPAARSARVRAAAGPGGRPGRARLHTDAVAGGGRAVVRGRAPRDGGRRRPDGGRARGGRQTPPTRHHPYPARPAGHRTRHRAPAHAGGGRTMTDCLFCKIANREIPAALIHEDDQLVAFRDINPQAPTHVLVVPRRHVATLDDLDAGDDGIVGAMVRLAASLARAEGFAAAGVPHRVQLQRGRRADGVPHPPAPARRPAVDLAAGLTPTGELRRGGPACQQRRQLAQRPDDGDIARGLGMLRSGPRHEHSAHPYPPARPGCRSPGCRPP